jgi:hypothetical protein
MEGVPGASPLGRLLCALALLLAHRLVHGRNVRER